MKQVDLFVDFFSFIDYLQFTPMTIEFPVRYEEARLKSLAFFCRLLQTGSCECNIIMLRKKKALAIDTFACYVARVTQPITVSYDCARSRVVMGDNMKGYNKTIIIGRVSSDPELKQVDGHDSTSFTIYNSILDANGKESIKYHRIDALDKQANLCVKYLKKGDLCCIEGHLHSEKRSYGKFAQIIVCKTVCFLSPKRK